MSVEGLISRSIGRSLRVGRSDGWSVDGLSVCLVVSHYLVDSISFGSDDQIGWRSTERGLRLGALTRKLSTDVQKVVLALRVIRASIREIIEIEELFKWTFNKVLGGSSELLAHRHLNIMSLGAVEKR